MLVSEFGDTSSCIEYAAYDRDDKSLIISFRHGDIYRYKNVPEELYDKLNSEESSGLTFNKHIRDRYDCERVVRSKT